MKDIQLNATNPKCVILFAAGSGGNPERHLPLLNSLTECGCNVVAPYFERITSPMPTSEELLSRASSLRSSLSSALDSTLPVIGVGHSIGAALLVALAGGQMYMRSGLALSIVQEKRLTKLILFTPPTGFFQGPNALAAIKTPIQLWAGTLDNIIEQSQVEYLKKTITKAPVDFHVIEGAGHFSFMNTLPPNIVDPMANREEFLDKLASEVCRFAIN